MKDKRLKKGYGRHTKPITITTQYGMLVALVSLGGRKITKISLSDIDILKEYSFYAHKRADGKYVARASQGRGPYLHRLILKPDPERSLEVDHVNANPLDNTRGNLREATTIQNNLAKKPELVYGYSGIVQIQKFEVRYKKDKYGRNIQVNVPHKFMAIGPNGKHHGPYTSMLDPEYAAEEAALKRDELMEEEYIDHFEDHEHHNFGFIHWNGDEPKESMWMEHYIEDQKDLAITQGIQKLEEMYPREVY